jgi:hypothetical protein
MVVVVAVDCLLTGLLTGLTQSSMTQPASPRTPCVRVWYSGGAFMPSAQAGALPLKQQQQQHAAKKLVAAR